jgi:hypothetical protein
MVLPRLAPGSQFVTGACTSDVDCQQGCCAFNTGKCAGPGIAQSRDGGCGFSSPKPNCNVAAALGLKDCVAGAVNGNLADPNVQAAAKFTAHLDGIAFTPASGGAPAPAAKEVAPVAAAEAAPAKGKSVADLAAGQKAKKSVFEQCANDGECQQGCCGFSSGKCAGPAVAQTNGSGGCGHGTGSANCDVAAALGFKSLCIAGARAPDTGSAGVQAAAAFAAQLDGIAFNPA